MNAQVASTSSNSKENFHPFFYNNSLLLQFILTEFLSVSAEIQKLKQLSDKLKKLNNASKEATEEDFIELTARLHKLVGSTTERMCPLPWNLDNGSMAKLKDYSDLLAQNLDDEDYALYNIHDYFHKALIRGKLTLDIVRLPHLTPAQYHQLCEKIAQGVHKIKENILSAARLMVATIYKFRQDENVLFFLLRHEQQIKELYGSNFLKKLFCKMYPNGLDEVEQFLLSSYEKRGFTNLLPIISQKLSDLRNESL